MRQKQKRSVFIELILGLCVLTLSLSPFSMAGYAFTGAWGVQAFLVNVWRTKLPKRAIFAFVLMMIWLLLRLFTNLSDADPQEFSKSYFQLLTSSVALYAIWHVVTHYHININFLSAIIILPTFFFTMVQVCELLIYGSTQSWFWVSDYSITTATNADRFQAVNLLSYIRPTAQYHEPSYLALVAFATCCLLDNAESKYKYLTLFFCLAVILASFSATVWIIVLGYFFWFFVPFIIQLLTFLPLLSLFLYYELYDFFRLSEIFHYGTSAWHRIGKPLSATVDDLQSLPLGVPMGNTEFVYDNSLFLIVSYFGVLSIPIFALLIFIFINNQRYRKPLYFFFAAMMVNGAIITIESTLLVGLVFMLVRRV